MIQVQVQLFSTLRACLPPGSERGKATISLPEGATLRDLLTQLGVDEYLGYEAAQSGWQMMVSHQPVLDLQHVLQDGDQVMVFPAIAGG